MKKKRIIRLSKVLSLLLFFLLALVCLVLLLGIGSLFVKNSSFNIQRPHSQGIVFFHASFGLLDEGSTETSKIANLLALIFTLPPWMALYYQAGSYFALLSEGASPFAAPLIKKMRQVNLLLYVADLLPLLVWPLIQWSFTGSLDISLALSNTLFMAIVLTILIEIFRYGADLQQEVEETV